VLQVKLEKPSPAKVASITFENGQQVLFDIEDLFAVSLYHWRLIRCNFRFYAYSTKMVDGSPCRISMHRLLANTPPGEVTHHLNKITLDNRKANLLNMSPRHHRQLHGIRGYRFEHKRKTTINDRQNISIHQTT